MLFIFILLLNLEELEIGETIICLHLDIILTYKVYYMLINKLFIIKIYVKKFLLFKILRLVKIEYITRFYYYIENLI